MSLTAFCGAAAWGWPVVMVVAVAVAAMLAIIAGFVRSEMKARRYPANRRCDNCGRFSRWSTAGCDHCDFEDK